MKTLSILLSLLFSFPAFAYTPDFPQGLSEEQVQAVDEETPQETMSIAARHRFLRQAANRVHGGVAAFQAAPVGSVERDSLRQEVLQSFLQVHLVTDANYLSAIPQGMDARAIKKVIWAVGIPAVALLFTAVLKFNYGDIPWFTPAADLPAYANLVTLGYLSTAGLVAGAAHAVGIAASPVYRHMLNGGRNMPTTEEGLQRYFMGQYSKLKGDGAGLDYRQFMAFMTGVVGLGATESASSPGRFADARMSEGEAKQTLAELARDMARVLKEQSLAALRGPEAGPFRSADPLRQLRREEAELLRDAESLIFFAQVRTSGFRRILERVGVMTPVRQRLRRHFFETLQRELIAVEGEVLLASATPLISEEERVTWVRLESELRHRGTECATALMAEALP